MKVEDLNEVKEQLKFAGIKLDLDKEIVQLLENDQPKSVIKFDAETETKDKLVVDLKFGKSEKTHKHYLNSFHIKMTKPDGSVMEQTFYQNFGANITFKEGINLMHGRSVYKTGLVGQEKEKYNAWLQLDVTKATTNGDYKYHRYTDSFGFDLEAKLQERGYKQMQVEEGKENYFVNAIKKGDRVLGTRNEEGREIKEYVEANPKWKTINVYDLNHKRQLINAPAAQTSEDGNVAQNQKTGEMKEDPSRQSQDSGSSEPSTSKGEQTPDLLTAMEMLINKENPSQKEQDKSVGKDNHKGQVDSQSSSAEKNDKSSGKRRGNRRSMSA